MMLDLIVRGVAGFVVVFIFYIIKIAIFDDKPKG